MPLATPEPIAVVGLAGICPGFGSSVEAFWQMICQQQSAMTRVPSERFNVDGFYHRNNDRLDSISTQYGNFIRRDLATFDTVFFAISPSEAAALDPQQRILLENTYRAFENAGISLDDVRGSKTSVYVAGHPKDYETQLARDPSIQSRYQATGTGTAMIAGRLSHFFDLRGPSLVLDTACSSSGYATHLACQSLRSGESKMSVIAGSNIILSPESVTIQMSNGGFLSPDGI